MKTDLTQQQHVTLGGIGSVAKLVNPETCTSGGSFMAWINLVNVPLGYVFVSSTQNSPHKTTGLAFYRQGSSLIRHVKRVVSRGCVTWLCQEVELPG